MRGKSRKQPNKTHRSSILPVFSSQALDLAVTIHVLLREVRKDAQSVGLLPNIPEHARRIANKGS
eukprot:2168979-Amphidinium_carterae.3